MFLSFLVIQQRRKYKIPYLTNDEKALITRFRAHTNFSEYVPLTLVLMAISIVFQIHYLVLLLSMIALIVARFCHAYELVKMEKRNRFNYRFYSVSTTFIIMGLLAI